MASFYSPSTSSAGVWCDAAACLRQFVGEFLTDVPAARAAAATAGWSISDDYSPDYCPAHRDIESGDHDGR